MAANGNGWWIGVGGLVLGVVIGYYAAEPAPGNPEERVLFSDLYMQTAAEYRALCLQTYGHAWECLQRRLQAPPPGDLPFAVVMDLDETVLDNSRYQSWLYRNRLSFSDESWAAWEAHGAEEVGLVPGAFEFITRVEREAKPPVKVFYISNRRNREGTLAALKHVKLDSADVGERLLLRTDGSDKESRRRQVEKGHRVLLLIGDNLADLSSIFYPAMQDRNDFHEQTDAINARLRRVDNARDRFGRDWIILPNPVYGDWPLPLGKDPARHLRATSFRP